MKLEPGMIAFWRYDLYPYVLHGTIKKVRGDIVETEECGPGYPFRPFFACSLRESRKYTQVLFEAKQWRQLRLKELERAATEKLIEHLPKVFHSYVR